MKPNHAKLYGGKSRIKADAASSSNTSTPKKLWSLTVKIYGAKHTVNTDTASSLTIPYSTATNKEFRRAHPQPTYYVT